MNKSNLNFKWRTQVAMALVIVFLVFAYLQLLVSSRLREKQQEHYADSLWFELDKYKQTDRYDIGYVDGLTQRKRMRMEAEKDLAKRSKTLYNNK